MEANSTKPPPTRRYEYVSGALAVRSSRNVFEILTAAPPSAV
jgi:hypothetical protein